MERAAIGAHHVGRRDFEPSSPRAVARVRSERRPDLSIAVHMRVADCLHNSLRGQRREDSPTVKYDRTLGLSGPMALYTSTPVCMSVLQVKSGLGETVGAVSIVSSRKHGT